jgi:hypothetical protein
MKVLLLDIPDFPGYKAGADGHIYSFKVRERIDYNRIPKRLSAHSGGTSAYLQVSLRRSGRTFIRTVHSLVCTAFHGERPIGLTASHINGNYLDNRPTNICWEPLKLNHRRKIEHGTDDRGIKNSRALFNAEDLYNIRQRLAAGETARSIATSFNCNERAIGKIKRGERYAA